MPDIAHAKTDRKIEQMEKRLSGIYSGSADIIEKKAADYFRQFERLDEKKRKQVEAGTLTEAEYKRWRKNKLLYAERFKTLQNQIATEMLNVNKTAIAYVNGQLPEVYAINYNSIGETVDGVGGYSFAMVDSNTVKELATRNSRLLPYKYIDQRKDRKWNMQNVHRSVLQSILTGESIPDMAKRLRGVEEMNRTQSIRTARTLTTVAENKGRQDGMEQAVADGIIIEKFWIRTHDARTREEHIEAGRRYTESRSIPIDKPFYVGGQYLMHPGDSSMGASGSNIYNCRCTMGTVVKGIDFGGGNVEWLEK